MKLWTIQPLERWQRIEEKGFLRALRRDPESFCPGAYSFMRERLEDKAGIAPQEECWPIWSWYQYDSSKKRRPDLRSSCLLQTGKRGVRLELEIDESRVLLSDFELWHMPLNCGAIFERWEDVEAFDEELKAAGFPHPLTWKGLEDVLAHPHFGKRLRQSWDRIFDLDWDNEEWTVPRHQRRIQAVFWEVRAQDVRRVEFFKAR